MAFRTNKMPVLQEKSASGAVATFNTALAMPLASCSIAVNAWQEGSGDPSPSNVRAIHGFSEVNATRAGNNLFDISNQTARAFLTNTGSISTSETAVNWNLSDFQPIKPNVVYHFNPNSTLGNAAKHGYYDKNKNFISAINSGEQTFTTPNNAYYMRFSYSATSTDIMLNFGSTALSYEPYVTPTIYTIQFGQEVYGAEVDVVNGVAHVTWIKKVITELLPNIGWMWYTPYKQFYNSMYMNNSPAVSSDVAHLKCDKLKPIMIATDRVDNIGNFSGIVNNGLGIAFSAPNVNSLDEAKAWVIDNPITFIYELATPFDIQLTPTQIALIGNNTIFADTGDVDLTYKDLDIAKRGNFREVFKLPS